MVCQARERYIKTVTDYLLYMCPQLSLGKPESNHDFNAESVLEYEAKFPATT